MEALGSQLSQILQRYTSETAARIVMRTVLEPRRLDPATLTREQLPELISSIILTATTFVGRNKLPEFKADLYKLLGNGSLRNVQFAIKTEEDASRARSAARNMVDRVGASALCGQQVATAVSEFARNQISYAGGGEIVISIESTPRQMIRIKAVDRGPGIKDLSTIMSGTYRSKTGMGLGLLGSKRMANRFDIQTGPTGTTIDMEIWI